MGVNYFTDWQILELKNNPNVKKVSNKSITYHIDFKERFIQEHHRGKLPRQIFTEAGFDLSYMGSKRVSQASYRWYKQSLRAEGLKDTRKGNSGRPQTRNLSKDEIINKQKAQIAYLKQERDFLLELKRLERQAIKKQQLSQKINLKSSKK